MEEQTAFIFKSFIERLCFKPPPRSSYLQKRVDDSYYFILEEVAWEDFMMKVVILLQ